MNYRNIIKIIISIAIAQSAGIVGSLFTISAIPTWYAELAKPIFNPPNWIFGPVWFLLYTLMGIALYFIWQKGLDKKQVRFAFIFFLAHLVLNALWSIVFFGLHNLLLALIVITLLWLMILASISLFWEIDKRASYLLIPYILWVSFATILNYSIWQLSF